MIYNFCPFNNENLIAELKILENYSQGVQTCITEASKTFKYQDKPYNFNVECNPKTYKYWQLNAKEEFVGKRIRVSRRPWFIKYAVNPWINEAIQRNAAASHVCIDDEDIVILSDVDEILYGELIPELVDIVKKREIITVPVIFTCFYLNLVCKDWPGPKNYSYRIFLMTGKKFNNLSITSDQLRKKGESGRLVNEVYCYDKFAGFHHSWLGDVDFIANKLRSYAHDNSDHSPEIFYPSGELNIHELNKRILAGNGIFPGQTLVVDSELKHLESVEKKRDSLSRYFI